MFRWFKEAFAILRESTPRWLASLLIAVVGGSLVLDEYYIQIIGWMIMRELGWAVDIIRSPITVWAAVIILLWLLFGILHKQVKTRYVEPRLNFDSFRTWGTGIGPDAMQVVAESNATVASVDVRNNPVGNNGQALNRAYCSADFLDHSQENIVLHVDYTRWTASPKPRRDETPLTEPRPRFTFDHNFIILEPNNSRYQTDFAVYHHNDGSLFAFSGGDQHLGWRNPDHVIRDDHVFVRLAVAGNEVPDSTNTWVELQVVDDQLQIEELCEDQMKVAEEKFLELGG